jgi:putative ABC transport system permease protein
VAADDEIGAPNTVILSHTYWQRRFGGAPDVLGKTLTIGAGRTRAEGSAAP